MDHHWVASLNVNDTRVWQFTTTRNDTFKDFEKKPFINASQMEFAPGPAWRPSADIPAGV
jgi:hypothetical protein